jgi:predicted O-methyltransferase YrrM
MFLEIAKNNLGFDKRLNLVVTDAAKWIEENKTQRFDYIFADTWHGKYLLLDEVLSMLNKGGLYIIDDMLPQPNWPDGHQEKATGLIEYLETKENLLLTKQVWATGIIIATKK